MAKKYSKNAHAIEIAMPKSHKIGGIDKYEVESAAHTMKRHEEIKANKKLHRAAKMHLRREAKLMMKVSKGK